MLMGKLWVKRVMVCTVAALTGLVIAPARGDDFFNLTASGLSGTNASASGGTLLKLADNLLANQSQFTSLAGQGFHANLSYGGVPNALQFSENAAGTSANLTIPSIGLSQHFIGANPGQLDTEIRNFIETDGLSAYSSFLGSVDQESPVASIDGNPQAADAFIATDAYLRFGQQRTVSDAQIESGNEWQWHISGWGGETSAAAGLNGYYIDGTINADWRITNNVALDLATVGQYREAASSTAYAVGETVGLPITIITRGSTGGFSWDVTPWAFCALAASYDQVSGSVIVGGGGTSSLNYQLGDFTFTLADQGNYVGDVAVVIDKYTFDTKVNQWILKNGGQVAWNPGQGFLFLDGGISYSRFLKPAAITDYWSPTGGVGVRIGKYSSFRVGYLGDFSKNYHSTGGEATLVIAL